jgi:hypothetical protein
MTNQDFERRSSVPARRHSDLVAALIDAVLNSPGRLSVERHTAFAGEPNAGASGVFAEKVRRHAYAVTDALHVAFLFNVVNRLADAFGASYKGEQGRRLTAAGLYREDYKVPAFFLQ